MSSRGSLSPAVSSNVFPTFAEAKKSLDMKLDQYQPLHLEDDSESSLRIFLKYLPLQGQVNLADNVERCSDDEELRQLAKSLDTGLLRPMLAHGGTTPAVTLSPRLGVEDSIEDLLSEDIHTAKELVNDNYATTVWQGRDIGALCQPFALGAFQENDTDERYRHAIVWVNIDRYFPDLRSRIGFSSGDINREENVTMLAEGLHGQFGRFRFVFEATQTMNRYRVKEFPKFARLYRGFLPPTRFVTFTSRGRRYPLPSPILLAVHAVIGNILSLSGRGEKIEEFKQHLGGLNLLSVSKLSMLSSGTNQQPHPNETQRRTPTMFAGAENQPPRSSA
ncbi:hypothetical protein BDV23DRAFT_171663 [Aspergillus alliaceus]|uniref:HNH nuclease domain-containing protein n=1 Tax=Petromyces alliaceus TaxID=209559 RepID=A0A5N7CBJ6_PETAA|nr:hypothetical protein BDV23DRAFT_171663 [Aspergillus alliaceus]